MRNRTIVTLALSYALLGLLMNSVGIVILQSIAEFGVTKPTASTLEACKDLSVVAASLLLVSAIPRFGYRRSLIAVLLVLTVTCVAVSVASAFPTMQILFLITGFAFGVTKIAAYSMIGIIARDTSDHASITAFIEGVFMAGVLAGAWIFGFFIESGDWLRVYWLIAALCLVALAAWWFLPFDEGRIEEHSDDAQVLPGLRSMLALATLPMTISALAVLFFYVLVEQGMGTWIPTFNREILHLSAATSVEMSSIFVAALGTGRLLSAVVLRRVGWLTVMMVCLATLAALIIVALPLANAAEVGANSGWADAPLAAYLFPLVGFFLAPIYPTVCSLVLSALPKAKHAAMIGLIVIFSALGGTIGSFLIGTLFERLPGANGFYVLLLPIALVAAGLLALRRRITAYAP